MEKRTENELNHAREQSAKLRGEKTVEGSEAKWLKEMELREKVVKTKANKTKKKSWPIAKAGKHH